MARLLGYKRVSSEDRETMGSIETQHEKIEKWADLHDHTIVAWFSDNDVSGTIPLEDREDGSRMLREAVKHDATGIVVYRLDRLGRRFKVIFDALDKLDKAGLRFYSATEHFDTGTPAGNATIGMLATFAGFERDTFLQRTTDGKTTWATQGCWMGGNVPYGYTLVTLDERRFLAVSTEMIPVCNLQECEVIQLMFRWLVEEELSSWHIARRLIALGVPRYGRLPSRRRISDKLALTEGDWCCTSVRSILTNPVYKGEHVYGGRRAVAQPKPIVRQVAPLVDAELWEKAQRQLTQNRDQAGRPTETPYLLKGLIKCSDCGWTYIGTLRPYGRLLPENGHAYRCGGKHASYAVGRTHLKDRQCGNRTLIGQPLEESIWGDCVYVLTHAEEAMERLRACVGDEATRLARLQEMIDQVAARLEGLAGQERELTKLRIQGMVRDEIFAENWQRIQRERGDGLDEQNRLQIERSVSREAQLDQEGSRQALEELGALIESGTALTPAERRYVIKRLVKRIVVKAPIARKGYAPEEPEVHIVWRTEAIFGNAPIGAVEYCFRVGDWHLPLAA